MDFEKKMSTPSSIIETEVPTTELYTRDDLTNEMDRRDNLRASMKKIDDNYLWQLTHLNGFLIKTRDNTLTPEKRQYYKVHALDSIETASKEIARIDEMINHLQVSQIKYINLMKEFEKNMI